MVSSWADEEFVAERDVNLTAIVGTVDFDEDEDDFDLLYEDTSEYEWIYFDDSFGWQGRSKY